MTQNEIILAVMRGCSKAQKNYEKVFAIRSTKNVEELELKMKEWQRWTSAVDVLNEILNDELKANESQRLNDDNEMYTRNPNTTRK